MAIDGVSAGYCAVRPASLMKRPQLSRWLRMNSTVSAGVLPPPTFCQRSAFSVWLNCGSRTTVSAAMLIAPMFAGFAIDHLGDIYLAGRLPLAAVTSDELDRVMGAVLEQLRHAAAVLLTEAVQADWHRQVLINLGESVPDGFDAFERIIDVVTLDDLHRAQGRERWREYTRLGHELVRHDLQQASTT